MLDGVLGSAFHGMLSKMLDGMLDDMFGSMLVSNRDARTGRPLPRAVLSATHSFFLHGHHSFVFTRPRCVQRRIW